MLLRVLGFELRLPLPLDYLSRYLDRAMGDVTDAGEDYDSWGNEEKEEYGVVKDSMETGLGRACRARAVSAWVNQLILLGCLRYRLQADSLLGARIGSWLIFIQHEL